MKRCSCERGGPCDKVSLCALTNATDEYTQLLHRIDEQVDHIEACLRHDLFKDRVKHALAELDELREILKERP